MEISDNLLVRYSFEGSLADIKELEPCPIILHGPLTGQNDGTLLSDIQPEASDRTERWNAAVRYSAGGFLNGQKYGRLSSDIRTNVPLCSRADKKQMKNHNTY